jgi:cell division septum initiation protein DivIVA
VDRDSAAVATVEDAERQAQEIVLEAEREAFRILEEAAAVAFKGSASPRRRGRIATKLLAVGSFAAAVAAVVEISMGRV